jgi:hypothetical protein
VDKPENPSVQTVSQPKDAAAFAIIRWLVHLVLLIALERGLPAMFVLRLALTIVVAALVTDLRADEPKTPVDFIGEIDGPGLKMAEHENLVRRMHLTADLDRVGSGNGSLILDIQPNVVDEFGFAEVVPVPLTPIKLDCGLKLIKRKLLVPKPSFELLPAGPIAALPPGPMGLPGVTEEEWQLYSVKGPKITSRLFLATRKGEWSTARLMVSDKDGKGRYAVHAKPPAVQLFEPCHPGCFPAGTLIAVAGGTKAVEFVRAGDLVTTVAINGIASLGKVSDVFITRNRLIEVQTDGAMLVTTETQPLALVNGELRGAGELKAGDQIQTWEGGKVRPAKVQSVKQTGRTSTVFNLVLGDPVLFVAGGFLARSKPPAPVVPAPAP